MFGNLFDEDSHGDGSPGYQLNQDPVPPDPRNKTGLSGIYNTGATCFFNTVIQVFAFTPEFRRGLFSVQKEELMRKGEQLRQEMGQLNAQSDALDNDNRIDENEKKRRRSDISSRRWTVKDMETKVSIAVELRSLYAALMLQDQLAVSGNAAYNSFKFDRNVGQSDAFEMTTMIHTAMADGLQGTSGESLIDDLYQWVMQKKTKCQNCGFISVNEPKEQYLVMQVADFGGLEDSLRSMFCLSETITSYQCDSCGQHGATQTTKIKRLPPVAIFVLNRVSYDMKALKRLKIKSRFTFPMTLNLHECVREKYEEGVELELASVMSHIGGTPTSGHYRSFIRDVEALGTWYKPEPAEYVYRKKRDVSANKKRMTECEAPEQLVASVLAKQQDNTLSVPQLLTEISNLTGSPWKSMYKKRYGTCTKFLRGMPQLFEVHNDNTVTLKLKDEQLTELLGADANNADPEEDANENCKMQGRDLPAAEMVNGFSEESAGDCWFHINDSTVTPIETKDLEKEYEGNSCAYVLTYRLKDISPPQAIGNPGYGIPQDLREEVEEKNRQLLEEREEYARKQAQRKIEAERKAREVDVEIHFHWHFGMRQGILQRTEEQEISMPLPRTSTLRELEELLKLLGGDQLSQDFHVYRMRTWSNKTHLYDELTGKDKTLDELGMEEGQKLFVWDGKRIDDQDVPTGLDSEPITLLLKQFNAAREITHNFPKNMTLAKFKVAVSQLTGIKVSRLKLDFTSCGCQDQEGAASDTLEGLHLKDLDRVLYDGSDSSAFASQLEGESENIASDQFIAKIENRLDKEAKNSWPLLELEVSKDMRVGEMKKQFMTMYMIDCDSAVVRAVNPEKGLQSPLDDKLTLEAAGVRRNTRLVLDSTQMSLTFRVSPGPRSDDDTLHVTVPRECTVEECRRAMSQVAGLTDPEEWRLCKTDHFGDRERMLEDLERTLDKEAIHSGAFLILEKGRMLPKGFISISAWLYPSPSQIDDSYSDDDKLDSITSRIQDLVLTGAGNGGGDGSPSCCRLLLGDVELSSDARLEEFRSRVQELLRCHLRQAAVERAQLRLSQVEPGSGRLRRVLRTSPHSTLKNLKLKSGCSVGVQIVKKAANPSPEEVVLHLLEKHAETPTYEPPQELVWNTAMGTTAASLRVFVATRLHLPQTAFVMAKHFPDEYRWLILKDNASAPPPRPQNNRNKSRKKQPTTNLRQKPFHLQDGDEIGVLMLASRVPGLNDSAVPTVKESDFNTVEDEHGIELLNEKRKEREAKKLEDGITWNGPKYKEIPLRIGDAS